MNRILRPVLAVLLAGSSLAASASEPSTTAGKVDRLTELLVKMMPMGNIFEIVAKENPAWPMQDKPGAVTPAQLACMRSELSVEGYRRGKRAEVEAYVAANPSRLASDLDLLEKGVADIFGRLVMAGAEAKKSGTEVDSNAVLKSATAEEFLSFITFVSDPKYAALRDLSGLGSALSLTKSAQENEAAGQQLGSSMAVQQMVKSLGACNVPPSVLFE